MRFPGARYVRVVWRLPSPTTERNSPRVTLHRCDDCHIPLVSKLSYTMGEYAVLIHYVNACPLLWQAIHCQWSYRVVRTPHIRLKRVCLACQRCRCKLVRAAQPMRRGLEPLAYQKAAFVRYSSRVSFAAAYWSALLREMDRWNTSYYHALMFYDDDDDESDDDVRSPEAAPPVE